MITYILCSSYFCEILALFVPWITYEIHYIHTSIYIYMYVYIYIKVNICSVYIHLCVCAYIYICMHSYKVTDYPMINCYALTSQTVGNKNVRQKVWQTCVLVS